MPFTSPSPLMPMLKKCLWNCSKKGSASKRWIFQRQRWPFENGLINWSLSDQMTRIVIPVGVAYGSDTALTEQLLLKVARENTLVLEKPEPSALFLGFGDNSLNFELRAFIQHVMRRIEVTDRLYHAIDHAFRKAGIVIAFPQRDVHLDTTEALDVRLITGNTPQKDTDSGSEPDRD